MADILPKPSELDISSFEEGFSNQVYRIGWQQCPRMVLRLPVLDANVFYIDRQAEIEVMINAANEKLSPAVLWHDNKGAVASQYVTQPSLDWSVKHTDMNIKRIAHALSRAHSLPAVTHSFCIYEVIEHYLSGIKLTLPDAMDLSDEWSYLEHKYTELEKVVPSSCSVLCHNDLNPKNVLMDDQQLWLIDWEYSGMGDSLFDLAVFARSHNLDRSQRMLLLSEYDPSLDVEVSLYILDLYGKAYALREMAWLLLKHLTTPGDIESLGFYHEFKSLPSLNPFYNN